LWKTLEGPAPKPAPKPSVFETAIDAPVFEAALPAPPAPLTRTLEMAGRASGEALRQAGLEPRTSACSRTGVAVGTTVGCMFQDYPFYRAFREGNRPDPRAGIRYLERNPAEFLRKNLGFDGPALTVATACSSGANAIGTGLEWIRSGRCERVLAGGVDELDRIPFTGFRSLRLLSDFPCRPFDRDRSGLNLGEGAGFLVLESRAALEKRGIRPELFLAGYATRTDAHHLTAPLPDGSRLERAIRLALSQAGIRPEEIAYVNAHGTATPDNDRVEGRVIEKVFGPGAVFGSTKGYTGHTLGAAGGLEAVIACLALSKARCPGTPGFSNTDPEIGIAPLTRPRTLSGNYALSTSLGFGGINAALVFGIERH
jgi:3-oxoacyl-(acyl-carrier-protein) synthase